MLNTFKPLSPDGTSAVSNTKASPSAEQVRGARLLRSFLNRRRLGLLKTGACFSSSDNVLFLGGSETTLQSTERSTAALGSAGRHKLPRSTWEDGTHRPPGADGNSAAPADAAFTGASTQGTPLIGIARVFDRADSDVASPAGEDYSQFLRRTAVSAENLGKSMAPIKPERSVEVALRPRSSLQLQRVPVAAAADVPASASARDGSTAAHAGDDPGQGSGCLDLCNTEDGKVDLYTRGDAARGAFRSKVSTLPAKLCDEGAVTEKHVSRKLTKCLFTEHETRSTTDGYQRHLEEHGEAESGSALYSAQSSKNQQLSRERQNMERPRTSHVAEEERSILIEQQQSAVATAEAAAAVLRCKVRALQAENERLVYRWAHQQTRTDEHGKLKCRFCTTDACGFKYNFLQFCHNYAEPAGAGTTNVCKNSSEAHDQIQVLKQQLAIYRRKILMLSQENDHLRGLCNQET